MDNHSTTMVDPRVLETMLPFFTTHFGNAASRNHVFGWTAEAAVENARGQVAALIGGDGKEIVWTSRRDRGEQPRDQGRRELLQEAGQPHHHRRDRAQERHRHLQAPPARGLRGHVPDAAEGRHRHARDGDRRDDRQDDRRQHHAREQRDRCRPGRQRDRRGDQGEEPEDAVPHRRRAGRRQDPVRRRGVRRPTSSRCRRTRCTARRASARCGCAASRASASIRSSTAAVTSAACARARSPVPLIVGFGKAAALAKEEMERRGDSPRARCASGCYRGITSKLPETYVNGSLEKAAGCPATSTSRSRSSRASRS